MHDIYASVTARIIAELQAGTAPWVRPWSGEADPMPRSALSQRPYRGINTIVLGMAAHCHGYATNKWLTFRQALQLGGNVRKGERSSTIVFYQLKEVSENETQQRNIPVLRLFNVFNVAQIDGLPTEYRSVPLADPDWDASAVAEQIITSSGATILYQGFKAFYSPATDRIYVPMRSLNPTRRFPGARGLPLGRCRFYKEHTMEDQGNTGNSFRKLFQIIVADYIEKKGQFSYLSWPFAVAQLRLADPTASWEVRRFDGLPYLKTETGFFVEVAVTVQGITLSQIHPVLDGKNRPMFEPTAFDINTSIMRCLVKAIALHGLGISVYAGEDLPDAGGEDELPKLPIPRPQIVPTPDLITPAQIKFVQRLIVETDADTEQLLAYFGFESLTTIPKAEVNRVIKALQSKARRAA